MPVTALVSPGAGGYQTDARLAGAAGVAVGGVRRPLFVTGQDMLDFFLLEDFVVDEEDGAARVAEKILHPLFL